MVRKSYKDGTMKLDYKSCEMIADELNPVIQQKYPEEAQLDD